MEFLEIIIFDETMILNDPIDSWPICDCLISFHSKGILLIVRLYQGSRDRISDLVGAPGPAWIVHKGFTGTDGPWIPSQSETNSIF